MPTVYNINNNSIEWDPASRDDLQHNQELLNFIKSIKPPFNSVEFARLGIAEDSVYCDPITGEIINIPVIFQGMVHDYDTLAMLDTDYDGNRKSPYNRKILHLKDLKPGIEFQKRINDKINAAKRANPHLANAVPAEPQGEEKRIIDYYYDIAIRHEFDQGTIRDANHGTTIGSWARRFNNKALYIFAQMHKFYNNTVITSPEKYLRYLIYAAEHNLLPTYIAPGVENYEACYELGKILFNGLHNLPQVEIDDINATKYMLKAIQKKHRQALVEFGDKCGFAMLYGIGVEKDIATGSRVLQDCAEENADSAFILAAYYGNGVAIKSDQELSRQYLESAVNLGHAQAFMINLDQSSSAEIILDPEYVRRDIISCATAAKKWYFNLDSLDIHEEMIFGLDVIIENATQDPGLIKKILKITTNKDAIRSACDRYSSGIPLNYIFLALDLRYNNPHILSQIKEPGYYIKINANEPLTIDLIKTCLILRGCSEYDIEHLNPTAEHLLAVQSGYEYDEIKHLRDTELLLLLNNVSLNIVNDLHKRNRFTVGHLELIRLGASANEVIALSEIEATTLAFFLWNQPRIFIQRFNFKTAVEKIKQWGNILQNTLIRYGYESTHSPYHSRTLQYLRAFATTIGCDRQYVLPSAASNVRISKSFSPPSWINDYLKLIPFLESNRFDLNCESTSKTNSEGHTPLTKAVAGNNLYLVKALLKCDARIDMKNKYGNTAMHIAIDNNYQDLAKFLNEIALKQGIDLNIKNNAGKTPSDIAREKGFEMPSAYVHDRELVTFLMDYRFSLNLKNLNAINGQLYTPITLAAKVGNLSVVKKLIKCGVSLTARNGVGNTALHMAIDNNQIHLATWLAEEADRRSIFINVVNDNNVTPEQIARIKLVELPVAQIGDKDLFNFLCKHGFSTLTIDLNKANSSMHTPLTLAVAQKNFNAFKKLLAYGADVCGKNALGNTALHIALWHDLTEIYNYIYQLAEEQALFLNIPNAEGITPTAITEAKGIKTHNKKISDQMLLVFLQKYHFSILIADLNKSNSSYHTPLTKAISMNNLSLAKRITNYGADIDAMNALGNTPLHIAMDVGNQDIIDWLVALGAKNDIRNANRETARDIAIRHNRLVMI